MFNEIIKVFIDVIGSDSSVFDAIKAIDASKIKIVAVSDEENSSILGMMSDGDIRRAFLAGASMEAAVRDYAHRDYHFLTNESQIQEAQKYLDDGLKAIPIGNKVLETGKVLAFAYNTDKVHTEQLSAIIMAGGKGTRLRPLTNNIPKPMIDVNGKPMLHHQIESLRFAGVKEIYISVAYLKEQIMDYFGDGKKYGVNIEYLEEDVPLGTAGSLKLLPDQVESLFCVNADLITNLDFKNMADFWSGSDADILTACQVYLHQIPFGVLEISDQCVKGIQEKPTIARYINTGMYVLGKRALDICRSIDIDIFDIPHLIDACISEGGKVVPFVVHESWADVGTLDALQSVHEPE